MISYRIPITILFSLLFLLYLLTTLLFPNYKVLFTPNSLLFQQENKENVIIDESNFEDLQEILRQVFCMKNAPMT